MSARIFLDTNILVYSFAAEEPAKQQRARDLIRDLIKTGNGIISWQVVQEFLNVSTHKFKVPLTSEEALDYLEHVLVPLWKVAPSPTLFQEALNIQRQTKYRFYDSLIVAAAIQSKATLLYSEDLQHGRMFGTLRIENPFNKI